MHLSINQ